jgi:PhnB protein
MSVTTVTHLNFRGQAREALAFYHAIFGGQLNVVAYKDFGHVQDPADADQVIWGQVVSDSGFRVMAYDVQAAKCFDRGENSFYVSLRGDTAQEITAHWEKLSEGALIMEALAPAKWTPLYGMLKDKFGVIWVLDVATQYAAA